MTSLTGLFQGFLQDGQRDAGNLHIHLQGGNAGIIPRDFEIHVAKEIFETLDV
jgi:hypothetical protein